MATLVPEAVTTTQPADDTLLPPLDSLYVRGRMAACTMVLLSAALFIVACVLPAVGLREVGGTGRVELVWRLDVGDRLARLVHRRSGLVREPRATHWLDRVGALCVWWSPRAAREDAAHLR